MQDTPVQMTAEDKKRVVEGFVNMLTEVVTKAALEGSLKENGMKSGCKKNRSKEFIERLLGEG